LGQIDTSLTLIEASLENITPISSDFNDLMELRNFISHHYQNGMELDKHAFKLFLNGEYYLRQKKLPEAVASFTYIQEQYSESSLADVAVFREALIRLKLNQISEAVALAEKLTETKFADRGWVLLGEIYEIFNTNPEAALTYYYRLLEDFPTSYLTEPVRLHVRNLKDQLKS
jgi:tetratricopeptide (TPR) repeat protein